MTKFTLEQKLAAVEEYLQGERSQRSIAKKIGANHKSLQTWIAQYEANGVNGFISGYTNYSVEFKMDVINYMNEKGTSALEAATVFNIPDPSTISKWERIFEEYGIDGLQSKKRRRPSMNKDINKRPNKQVPAEGSVEALQAEVEYLRMENAYLKKLNALVQNKGKSPKNTRLK